MSVRLEKVQFLTRLYFSLMCYLTAIHRLLVVIHKPSNRDQGHSRARGLASVALKINQCG